MKSDDRKGVSSLFSSGIFRDSGQFSVGGIGASVQGHYDFDLGARPCISIF